MTLLLGVKFQRAENKFWLADAPPTVPLGYRPRPRAQQILELCPQLSTVLQTNGSEKPLKFQPKDRRKLTVEHS